MPVAVTPAEVGTKNVQVHSVVVAEAEHGIRGRTVTGVQTCALPIFTLAVAVLLTVAPASVPETVTVLLVVAFSEWVAVKVTDAPAASELLPPLAARSEERRVGRAV